MLMKITSYFRYPWICFLGLFFWYRPWFRKKEVSTGSYHKHTVYVKGDIAIIEIRPEWRNIFLIQGIKYVYFPYCYFVIKYHQSYCPGFLHHEKYTFGWLHVGFSSVPLSNVNQRVSYLPLGNLQSKSGSYCLGESLPGHYNSVEEVSTAAINLFFHTVFTDHGALDAYFMWATSILWFLNPKLREIAHLRRSKEFLVSLQPAIVGVE